jgi:hypothetical protein
MTGTGRLLRSLVKPGAQRLVRSGGRPAPVIRPAPTRERPGMTRRLLLITICAVACGDGGTDRALSEPLIDTLAGGVIQVTNTGPTMWADTNGWRLVEELVIDPAEGSPGEFSDVTKLVADDAGNVYVMQIMPAAIKAFDAQGNWLRDIGRAGDGPGEFRDGMLFIHGDTLLVQDPNNQRITTFLTDGTLIGTATSQCCFFTSPLPTVDGGLAMIMGHPPAGREDARYALYLTRMDGTVVDTIVRRSAAPPRVTSAMWTISRSMPGGATQRISLAIPGDPREQSTWRSDRQQVIGNTGVYRLILRRNFEDTLRIIDAPAVPLTFTDAERDSVLQATIAEEPEDWREAIRGVARADQIPATRPLWSQVATDREHRIWVGLPGPGAEVATLDVFSKEGVLLGKVPAPHPAILEDGFWARDRVYLRDSDADGRPIVRVYRLDRTVP